MKRLIDKVEVPDFVPSAAPPTPTSARPANPARPTRASVASVSAASRSRPRLKAAARASPQARGPPGSGSRSGPGRPQGNARARARARVSNAPRHRAGQGQRCTGGGQQDDDFGNRVDYQPRQKSQYRDRKRPAAVVIATATAATPTGARLPPRRGPSPAGHPDGAVPARPSPPFNSPAAVATEATAAAERPETPENTRSPPHPRAGFFFISDSAARMRNPRATERLITFIQSSPCRTLSRAASRVTRRTGLFATSFQVLAAADTAPADTPSSGKQIYEEVCSACHGHCGRAARPATGDRRHRAPLIREGQATLTAHAWSVSAACRPGRGAPTCRRKPSPAVSPTWRSAPAPTGSLLTRPLQRIEAEGASGGAPRA